VEPLRLLLPPSEGKAPGGDGPPYDPAAGGFPRLRSAREKVRKGLRHREFDAVGQLGVKGVALAGALAINRSIAGSPTLPALRRYTGVLYDALGYDTLEPAERDRLDEEVLVVSGLLGLVRGGDPVPNYKAPMGAAVPGAGRLASYWKPCLAKELARDLGDAVVWDLLPGIHAAAAPIPSTAVHWKVRVLREKNGRLMTVSHENKTIKGALARVISVQRLTDPAALSGWTGPGGYRVRSSTEPAAGRPGVVELVASEPS